MDPSRFVNIVRRWLWLLVLAAVVAAGSAFWIYNQQTPLYAAQAKLVVGPGVDSPNPDLNALRTGGQLMQTYAQLSTTRPVLQAVISSINLNTTPDQLIHKLEVRSDLETQILTLRAQDSDPQRAAAIANAVAEKLVSVSSASSTGPQAQIISQMPADVEKMRQITRQSEANISQLEAQLVTPDPETGRLIHEHAQRIQELEAELQKPVDEATVGDIKNREDKIRQLDAALQATVIVTARTVILDQLTLEDKRLTDERNSDADRKRLILDQLTWERSRLADFQQADTARITLIRDQIAQERTRLSEAQRNLAQLYTAVQTSVTNQLKIIEPAIVGTPVAQSMVLTVGMAAAAGFVMALMLALIYEYLDDTIKTREDLAKSSGFPFWGTIPRHKKLHGVGRERLVVEAIPQSPAAESYRVAGAQLLSASENTPLRSVLVSNLQLGGDNAETSANLAVTLAQAGKRVVLIDANLRCPTTSQLFGLSENPGLTEALADETKRVPCYKLDWAPGLSLLPSGAAVRNPFQLLVAPRLMEIVKHFEQDNDIIIIAASPLLGFSDSLLLASRVDGVLLIVRAGQTPRELVRKAVESQLLRGAKVIGILLSYNRATPMLTILPRVAASGPLRGGMFSQPLKSIRHGLSKLWSAEVDSGQGWS